MFIWELAKYRLHKKIPNNLPFHEKKKRLIESEEWHGMVYQRNKHLLEDELTETNIQTEIDKVAISWGIELQNQFEKLEWIPIALNKAICKIYIPS